MERPPEGMKEPYAFNSDGFKLFGWNFGPVMLLTLGPWLVMYWRKRKGLKRKLIAESLPK